MKKQECRNSSARPLFVSSSFILPSSFFYPLLALTRLAAV
jgi:hypothetical protein